MESNLEQRYALRFCFLAGFTATNAYEMLKYAYSDSFIGCTATYHWYSEFKAGRMEVEDLPRSGRPTTTPMNKNIARVVTTLKEDHNSIWIGEKLIFLIFLSIRPVLSIIDKKCHLSIKNQFCLELQKS